MNRDRNSRPAAAKGKRINVLGREAVVIDGRRARKPGMPGGPWTAREDYLVRTLPVAKVVAKTGRSVFAVRVRRQKLGVSPPVKRWSVEEDLLVMRLPTKEAAARTGRSESAVHARRAYLGIRPPGANAGRAR